MLNREAKRQSASQMSKNEPNYQSASWNVKAQAATSKRELQLPVEGAVALGKKS